MRLGTLASSFIFQFPSDFLPIEVINSYKGFLEAYHMPYDNIIDYINSTIKSVSFPGLSLNPNEQKILRGKQIAYKPATPAQDLVQTHEITVTFKDFDGHVNYFLMYQIFQEHYLDHDHLHINPFVITTLDMFRNAVYRITFYQLIMMNLSELKLDYSIQKINPNEFSVTFRFNFIDVEFLYGKSKILDVGSKNVIGNSNPIILNK